MPAEGAEPRWSARVGVTAGAGGTGLAVLAVMAAGGAAAALLLALPYAGTATMAIAAGAIGFAAALWLSGNPRLVCLWGVVATAPVSLQKRFMPIPHMGGSGAFAVEVSDLFLLMLVVLLMRDLLTGRRRAVRFPVTARWWLALIGLGVVGFAAGPLRTLAAQQVVQMTKELLFFLVVVNELTRARQFEQVLTAVALTVLGQSLIGFAEFVHHGALGLEALGEATDETFRYAAEATYLDGSDATFRVGALLGHPNLFAGYLALFLPLLVAGLMTGMAPGRRLLFAASLVAGLGALVLTLSRSGWLSFGIAFAILMGLTATHPRLRRRFVALRLGMVATLAVGLIAAAPQIIRRLTQSDAGALNFRYEWMEVAWTMVQQHPVFGIGLNTFVYHLPGNTQYGDVEGLNQRFGEVWPVVHNIYLIIWSEQGTLGFALFVLVCLGLLASGIRNMRSLIDERLYLINIGAVAGLVAIMTDGLGSFFLRNPQCARCFWLVAALVVAIGYWQRANRRLLTHVAA